MDVLELIDELRGLVHGAKQVPLRDQVRVDRKHLYDLLDQMRSTIPEEIEQARLIVKEREEMLAEAKREAERIVEEARERQTQLVAEHQLIRQAERAAQDIIYDARVLEREIRLGAEDYAAEILDTLEVNLSKFITAVQRGRARLQRPGRARRGRVIPQQLTPARPPFSGSASRSIARVDAPSLAIPASRSTSSPEWHATASHLRSATTAPVSTALGRALRLR